MPVGKVIKTMNETHRRLCPHFLDILHPRRSHWRLGRLLNGIQSIEGFNRAKLTLETTAYRCQLVRSVVVKKTNETHRLYFDVLRPPSSHCRLALLLNRFRILKDRTVKLTFLTTTYRCQIVRRWSVGRQVDLTGRAVSSSFVFLLLLFLFLFCR